MSYSEKLYGIIPLVSADVHPPYYFFLVYLWRQFLPSNEFTIRLISAIFGTMSIYMIYKLGSGLKDKKTGLIAAFLLTFNLFHLEYSQEARSYSLLLFFIILSVFSLSEFLKTKSTNRKTKYSILYIISTTIMLYTHFYAIFVWLAEILFLLLKTRGKFIKRWLLIQFFVLYLFLPWCGYYLNQAYSKFDESGPASWIEKPNLAYFFEPLFLYLGKHWYFNPTHYLISSFFR